MPVSNSRKLTAAQARTLRLLGDYASRYGPTPYTCPPGVQWTTLEVLYRRGLVEKQERPTTTVARLTDAGREMLRLMAL